jgi:hypothetical protein
LMLFVIKNERERKKGSYYMKIKQK